MPMKGGGWEELMLEVDRKSRLTKNDSRASYNFRNIYFLDDMMHGHQWFQGIPKYLHMLQVSIFTFPRKLQITIVITFRVQRYSYFYCFFFLTARVSFPKLYKAWAIREMFSQSWACNNVAQSFSAGLSERLLHLVSGGYWTGPVATLQGRLCPGTKELWQGISTEFYPGHDHLAL